MCGWGVPARAKPAARRREGGELRCWCGGTSSSFGHRAGSNVEDSSPSTSPPTRDTARAIPIYYLSILQHRAPKVPPAVLTQAKTPLLVYRFFADLNVRVFERTAILSNFVGPIWILPLAILILNPLPCLSEILERRPPCIGGQVTSIGVIDRAVCVSAPTAEYLNEANLHDHKGNYRKCSHLTGMLVVLSAVRTKGGPKRPPPCAAQVLRITLSQRLVALWLYGLSIESAHRWRTSSARGPMRSRCKQFSELLPREAEFGSYTLYPRLFDGCEPREHPPMSVQTRHVGIQIASSETLPAV